MAQDPARPFLHVDGYVGMLHDTAKGTYITDSTVPLLKAGIKVESYTRHPHRLVVLPDTLRTANIAVEQIVLI